MGSYVLHIRDGRLVCGVHLGMAEEQSGIGDGQTEIDGEEDLSDLGSWDARVHTPGNHLECAA